MTQTPTKAEALAELREDVAGLLRLVEDHRKASREAAAAYRAVEAERDALQRKVQEMALQALADDTQHREVEAERDALRADAERYRWLRQGDNDEEVLRFHEWATEVWVDPPPMYLPRLERLVRVIDAARENEDMLNDALLHPGMSPKSVSGTPEPTPSPAPSFFESLASMRFDNEPVVHAFAVHVLRQTGRDLAYHKAAGTTGIEFGLSCWQAAMAHAREAVESVPVPRTWDFVTSRHAWITAQDFDDYRVAVLRALGGK